MTKIELGNGWFIETNFMFPGRTDVTLWKPVEGLQRFIPNHLELTYKLLLSYDKYALIVVTTHERS